MTGSSRYNNSPVRGPKRDRETRDYYSTRPRNDRYDDSRRQRNYDDFDAPQDRSRDRHHRDSRAIDTATAITIHTGVVAVHLQELSPTIAMTVDTMVLIGMIGLLVGQSSRQSPRGNGAVNTHSSEEKQVMFQLDGNVTVGPTESPITKEIVEPVLQEELEFERRKKRRAELLAKLEASKSSAPTPSPSVDSPPGPDPMSITSASVAADTMPMEPTSAFNSPSTPPFIGDVDLSSRTTGGSFSGVQGGQSAADFDATADKEAEDRRHAVHRQQMAQEEIQSVAETKEDEDDEEDDMFADDFDVEKAAKHQSEINGVGGLLEDVDKEGYYKIRVGDILAERYQLQSTLGKGMFSGVARATDLQTNEVVAIKIIRDNDALRKGGFTEVSILQKLNQADPENKRHLVKFIRSFEHRGHLCMVFENLSLNLREVLRKFGNNVGINLQAVKAYAYQMFVALAHMESCHIIHADLKPDNILVNETRNVLKICDLGTAIDKSDAANQHTDVTPYLVSRFYRAPEIIMGIPYSYAVDVWSIGCTLYEMYTGSILFPGSSNNQMLKEIQAVRGRITPKLFKRGAIAGQFFNDKGEFVSIEEDEVLNRPVVKILPVVKMEKDLRSRLMEGIQGEKERAEVGRFVELLEGCLALNPDRRWRAADALKSPFFRM